MKNKIEQQIFEKMKAKDFGESMCNETKRKVLRWVMQKLRQHDVVGQSEQLKAFADYVQRRMWEGEDKDISEFVEEFLSL